MPGQTGTAPYYGLDPRLFPNSPARANDLLELRRQQAEFNRVRHDISRQNSWMAAPALAPAAVAMGLGGAGMLAARLAGPAVARLPHSLTKGMPPLRGDFWATQAGRRAHQALRERVEQKPGWKYEPHFQGPKGLRKPDVGAPVRDPAAPKKRYLMELKPDTPRGRQAGKRAAKIYKDETENKTRVIYYNPKDYM